MSFPHTNTANFAFVHARCNSSHWTLTSPRVDAFHSIAQSPPFLAPIFITFISFFFYIIDIVFFSFYIINIVICIIFVLIIFTLIIIFILLL